jgi:hypothetical protein
MNIEALNQLLRVLEEARMKKLPFSLTWYEMPVEGHPEMCRCTLGLAAKDHWFTSRGLTLHNFGGFLGKAPVYERWSGVTAGMKFFDLTYDAAVGIFFAEWLSSGNEIDDVIDRVEQLIADNG